MHGQALTLRTYQKQAITNLRDAYRAGSRAPLLVMPTGAGKTQVFGWITAEAAARGRRILILVHRRELIAQASRKLASAGVEHGIIAAGIERSATSVQVASVQTLVRSLDACTHAPDLIVIDEAHHAVAGSWEKILKHWPDAFRLGVTATPMRKDGRGLGAMFDRIVLGPSAAQLVAAGFLSPSRVYAPPLLADLTQLRARAGDYTPEDAADVMDRPTITGDAIAHYQRHAAGKQAIAFCCSVKHATSVCDAFNAAGISAALLLGATRDRDAVVSAFATQQTQVLVTVDVVSEGFDIPAAVCAILLRPTQSEALYLQQVGRVLRPAEGKSHALILDHCGNVLRHGFPDDHRDYGLDDRRRRMARTGPPAPAVRTCPECFAAFKPQPLCPVCGALTQPSAREITQKEGELRELKREEVRLRAKGQRREVARARTITQLLAIAQERGYSPGWAYRVAAARGARHG